MSEILSVQSPIFIPNNFCENANASRYIITPRDVTKQRTLFRGLQIGELNGKLFYLFLNQNICCGYSKESSRWDGSFEHLKHMFNLMDKKINTILLSKISVYLEAWLFQLKSILKSPTTLAPQRIWSEMDGFSSRNLLYCPKLFRFVQRRGRRLVKSGQ